MTVTCASCGTEHESGARFCSACGSPLYRACPSCGAEQLAGAAFCSACGVALEAGARRAAATDEREERRVVTVLFADLAGSTALGERPPASRSTSPLPSTPQSAPTRLRGRALPRRRSSPRFAA